MTKDIKINKIDKSIIRYGSDKAVVSALFDCFNDSNTYKLLEEMDIDIEDNDSITYYKSYELK